MALSKEAAQGAATKARNQSNLKAVAAGKQDKSTKQSNVDTEEMYKNINLRLPLESWKKLRIAATEESTSKRSVTVTGLINQIIDEYLEKQR